MRVSVITPTSNRPVGFALAEIFMARQTRQPDEWIVADGGMQPVVCTLGQVHLHEVSAPGPKNFAGNLLRALDAATGDVIVCFEDDDHYKPEHLERLVARLAAADALIAGDDDQRYYNVLKRCWRTFNNEGGCLCQTAFRRELVPVFQTAIRGQIAKNHYGIDTAFWKAVPRARWNLARDHTVLGIKGLPGQVGLGIGHRPGSGWTADPRLTQLTAWIGDDVSLYVDFAERAA